MNDIDWANLGIDFETWLYGPIVYASGGSSRWIWDGEKWHHFTAYEVSEEEARVAKIARELQARDGGCYIRYGA